MGVSLRLPSGERVQGGSGTVRRQIQGLWGVVLHLVYFQLQVLRKVSAGPAGSHQVSGRPREGGRAAGGGDIVGASELRTNEHFLYLISVEMAEVFFSSCFYV